MPWVEDLPSSRSLVPAAGNPVRRNLLEAVADWCSCLEGRLPLTAALKCLAEGSGARAVCLSRHSRVAGGSVRAVVFNACSLKRTGLEVSRSFTPCVLGHYVGRARPASLWFSSSGEGHGDPALAVFQKRAGIAETAVIALALEETWADYLELHFAQAPTGAAQDLLNSFAGTLSRTWARRRPGLFSEAILTSRAQARPGVREPILSAANPARLTRSEFRVCLLLSRGLNTTSVCSELSISPSTLKSHLRAIFDKTEVTSMAELLYLLLAPSKGEAWSSEMALMRRA